MNTRLSFLLDGAEVPFTPGQSVIQAALAAGRYIPHLCYHPEFTPHGSCKLCTVRADGRPAAACTLPARAGLQVDSETEELRALRRTLVQMLFAEGNHFCPSCEKSGNCVLQALGYELEVHTAGFRHFFLDRPVDASHPDILLDFNRCVLCRLCVRASEEVDGKGVFYLGGRGVQRRLLVSSESGRLADTDIAVTDKAVEVCPVGVILRKHVGFAVPIGRRRYDVKSLRERALEDAPRGEEGTHG
ncbi:MAG: 2Fe-2S iron-sulfur cluster-binding protein [Thiobacillaceae bacterium]|nr:2Fe-2S iron-sulfur cluster-binding protein [Thiobacillaceae bacterium]